MLNSPVGFNPRRRLESLPGQIKDKFETEKSAGAVDGTSAEPGPGTRSVTDTENKISIGS